MRSTEPRAWPAPAQPAHSAPLAARATCASASTSIASLPPSSTVTSFSWETHARATARPTVGEPVNSTLSTGARASATPTCVPPCTTRTRPSGSVARASTPMIRSPVRHARRAGLNTTPLPASSAPAICASGCANGALPAPITPTTPNGSYATRARCESAIERWMPTRLEPSTRAPSSAIQISASIAASSSVLATSARGRPCSRPISRASSSNSSMIACATRRM